MWSKKMAFLAIQEPRPIAAKSSFKCLKTGARIKLKKLAYDLLVSERQLIILDHLSIARQLVHIDMGDDIFGI
jgi:hypothetical protein